MLKTQTDWDMGNVREEMTGSYIIPKEKVMYKSWKQISESVIQNNYPAYNILQEIIDLQ